MFIAQRDEFFANAKEPERVQADVPGNGAGEEVAAGDIANFLSMFPPPDPNTFTPNNNACVACHRIGSSTCKTFVKTYAQHMWMPPGFSSSASVWHQTYDDSMAQLDRCCNDVMSGVCRKCAFARL